MKLTNKSNHMLTKLIMILALSSFPYSLLCQLKMDINTQTHSINFLLS